MRFVTRQSYGTDGWRLGWIKFVTVNDDHHGDYSLRDYELFYSNEMDKLVEMGLVKNYIGSRMANLYCIKDEEKVEKLIMELYEFDTK